MAIGRRFGRGAILHPVVLRTRRLVVVLISSSDSGVLGSSQSVITISTVTSSDSATAASTEGITGIGISGSDSGGLSQSESIADVTPSDQRVFSFDLGTASVDLLIAVGASDAASITDAGLIVAGFDSGVATESWAFQKSASETVVGVDTEALVKLATDTAVGTESVSIFAHIFAPFDNNVGTVAYTPLSPLPNPDSFHWAVWDEGNYIYLSDVGNFLRYDIAANTFTASLAQPAFMQYGSAVLWYNNKLYKWGGGFATPTAEVYNPATNIWTSLNNLPLVTTPSDPLYQGFQWQVVRAVLASDGNIYLWDLVSRDLITPFEDSQRVAHYDPIGDTTTVLLTTQITRPYGAVVADSHARIWYMGGNNSSGYANFPRYYDIGSNSIITVTGADPTPADDVAAAIFGDAIYVFGGDDSSPEEALASVRGYDILNDSWTALVPLADARSDIALAQAGSQVFLFGGWQDSDHFNDDSTFTTLVTLTPPAPSSEIPASEDRGSARESTGVSPNLGGTGGGGGGGTTLIQWAFIDPRGVVAPYVFDINPNQMSDPTRKKTTTSVGVSPVSSAAHRGYRTNRLAPREWTFSGVTITQDQQDKFLAWFNIANKIWLRDHFGRIWEVRLMQFDQEPRPSSRTNPLWRFHYTFTAQAYRRIS